MRLAVTIRYMDTEKDNKFRERYYLPRAFVKIAEELGIELIPVTSMNTVDFVGKYCDALLVTGSNIDIEPKYYGKSRDDGSYLTPVDEYELDKALMYEFIDRPVLGICGGMQAMNVFHGGTLKRVSGHREPFEHKAVIVSDLVSDIFGSSDFSINSYHSWAADKIGNGLIEAVVSDDGVTECIVSRDNLKLGVQWHPEIMDEKDWRPIFNWLFTKTRHIKT